MNTQPENIVSYKEGINKLSKEAEAIAADIPETQPNIKTSIDALNARFERWQENWKTKSLEEKKENTRNSLGCWIIGTFCVLIGLFALCGAYTSMFLDESHTKNFLSVIQPIGSMLVGAVGFVLGHYFTNKDGK